MRKTSKFDIMGMQTIIGFRYMGTFLLFTISYQKTRVYPGFLEYCELECGK